MCGWAGVLQHLRDPWTLVFHNEVAQKEKQREQFSTFPVSFSMNFALGKLAGKRANHDHVIAACCDVAIMNQALGCHNCYQMIIGKL